MADLRIQGLLPAVNKFRKTLRTQQTQPVSSTRPEQVYCIGFHKTGTTSLAMALEELGYNTVHGDRRGSWPGADEGRTLIKMIEDGNFDLPTFDIFDAFTDNPYFSIWREIDNRRTGKFILTVRDEDAWIESCVKYYKGRRIRPMRDWMFGAHGDPSSSPEARQTWLDAYRRHNEDVCAHFEGRPEFRVIEVTNGDGWDVLCPLLNVAVPSVPFPHRNQRKKRQKT